MSLYNALFGTNPMAGLLLTALDLSAGDVPRFRDCYLDTEGAEPRIAVHTRTGGGNRDYHENEETCRANFAEYFTGNEPPDGPWNDDLRDVEGYLSDEDDDFDSTYATFYYRVPKAFEGIVRTMLDASGESSPPRERWQKLFDDLSSAEKSPETERALKVGETILGQIDEALARGESQP